MKNQKVVELKNIKHERYVARQLENLGLDKEYIQDYDKSLFMEDVDSVLTEYFQKRDDLSNEFNKWVSSKAKCFTDMTIIISIKTEHMQNLIVPDSEYFFDLVLNPKEENLLVFDHWINVQSELEKLHLSSISTFIREKLRDKVRK
jgi:hypothetical protein